MATKKSTKKRSSAFRLVHEETGHHYILRLGREGYDKLKDKKIKKFHPKLKTHVDYVIKRLK